MINITTSIFDSSGYSIHGRNLANALNNIPEARITTNAVPNWQALVNDKELEMLKRKPEKDEWQLIITSPVHWRMNLGKNNICYLVFEGDKIPKSWLMECLNPDIKYIIVPSKHTKEAIINTLFKYEGLDNFEYEGWKVEKENRDWSKIKIIPHGVDLNLFYPKEKPNIETFKYIEPLLTKND